MNVRLGVLSRTHGLDGALRLQLDGPVAPALVLPADVSVGYSESFVRPMRLTRFDRQPNGDALCGFDGIDSAESASTLVDQALFVPSDSVRYADPHADPRLLGCHVISEDGADLGEIVDLFLTPAHVVWTIAADGGQWMLPAVAEFVVRTLPDDRSVVVRTIPGMIDGTEEDA